MDTRVLALRAEVEQSLGDQTSGYLLIPLSKEDASALLKMREELAEYRKINPKIYKVDIWEPDIHAYPTGSIEDDDAIDYIMEKSPNGEYVMLPDTFQPSAPYPSIGYLVASVTEFGVSMEFSVDGEDGTYYSTAEVSWDFISSYSN